jgi:type I restriction enzyme M protein
MKRNVLTSSLDRQDRAERGLPIHGYDVVLANPPFSGKIDKDRIVDDVKVGSTTATEILFLKYMLDSLKPGGRCGVIVPEGVLFGSTGAHKEIRRQLIENNTVEAVLSLPGGVFQPYSGVKTSALVFSKGGTTDKVMFLHADNDGFKLDAQHDTPIDADDLPSLVAAYQSKDELKQDWVGRDEEAEWPEKWWFADADTIRANDFNLSAGRYRPMSQAQAEHQDPLALLDELKAIETEIMKELDALNSELREQSASSGEAA